MVDRVCNEVVWWFVSWVAALTQLHLYFRHFTQQLNGSEGCPIEQKTLIKNPKTKPSGSNLIFEPSRDVHALVPPTSGRPTTADVTTDTSRGKVSSPPRVLRSDRLDRLGAQERGSKRSLRRTEKRGPERDQGGRDTSWISVGVGRGTRSPQNCVSGTSPVRWIHSRVAWREHVNRGLRFFSSSSSSLLGGQAAHRASSPMGPNRVESRRSESATTHVDRSTL